MSTDEIKKYTRGYRAASICYTLLESLQLSYRLIVGILLDMEFIGYNDRSDLENLRKMKSAIDYNMVRESKFTTSPLNGMADRVLAYTLSFEEKEKT